MQKKKKSLLVRIVATVMNWLRFKNEIKVCRHYYTILRNVSDRPRIPDTVADWRRRENVQKRKRISMLRAKLEMQNQIENVAEGNKLT